jgi:hypothetical protein
VDRRDTEPSAVERIVLMIPGGGFDVWIDEVGFY